VLMILKEVRSQPFDRLRIKRWEGN